MSCAFVTRRRTGRVASCRLADTHIRPILGDAARHVLEPGPAEDLHQPVGEATG